MPSSIQLDKNRRSCRLNLRLVIVVRLPRLVPGISYSLPGLGAVRQSRRSTVVGIEVLVSLRTHNMGKASLVVPVNDLKCRPSNRCIGN